MFLILEVWGGPQLAILYSERLAHLAEVVVPICLFPKGREGFCLGRHGAPTGTELCGCTL